MAMNHALYEYSDEDEDYIDMDITSPSSSQEFEFQMPFTPHITQYPAISTADELFHDGKILPLHRTRRRNILPHQNTVATDPVDKTKKAFREDGYFSHHAAAKVDIAQQALQEDGYVSGKESNTVCIIKSLDRVGHMLCTADPMLCTSRPDHFRSSMDSVTESCEMDLDDYLYNWHIDYTGFIEDNPKEMDWTKKLKLISNFSYNKSADGTDHKSSAEANPNPKPVNMPKTDELSNNLATLAKKTSLESLLNDTYQTADGPNKGIEQKVRRKAVSDAKCFVRLS